MHGIPMRWNLATSRSDDLKRRDFTSTQSQYDPSTNELTDEHGGAEDLKRRLIATVGTRMSVSVKTLFACCAQSGSARSSIFMIEAKTMAGMANNAGLTGKISRERMRDEFITDRDESTPDAGAFYGAQKIRYLRFIAPALEEGIGCDQNQAHSYDVFEHNLRSLQHAADNDWSFEVRLAACFTMWQTRGS